MARQYAELPTSLFILFLTTFSSLCAYATYSVFIWSWDYKRLSELVTGPYSTVFERPMDDSDNEWREYPQYFTFLFPWLIIHHLLGQISSAFIPEYRGYIFLVVGLVAICYEFGWLLLSMLLLECFYMYIMTAIGNFYLVLMASFGLSLVLLIEFIFRFMIDVNEFTTTKDIWGLILLVSWTNLRCFSFASEKCCYRDKIDMINQSSNEQLKKQEIPSKDKKPINVQFSFTDLLTFVFYLPPILTGPASLYYNFYADLHNPQRQAHHWTKARFMAIFWEAIRLALVYVFCYACIHYFYFNIIQLNPGIMMKIPLWTLTGVSYNMGVFFYLKYYIIYGASKLLASIDEIILPDKPKCVSTIFKFSQMWRTFDVGLYDIMKRNLFLPFGGSTNGRLMHVLSSACCFFYVFLWHGGNTTYAIWCSLNLLNIQLESLLNVLFNWPRYISLRDKFLSPLGVRLIEPILYAPLTTISYIAIFTFFSGARVGLIIWNRVIANGTFTSIFLSLLLAYSGFQWSTTYEAWKSARTKVKQS